MKKKNSFRFLFLFLILSVFALFLNGCLVFIGNPIVEININDNWRYDIYVDGSFQGTTDSSGRMTLYNLSSGYHHFEAHDTSILGRYGDKWQTITSGYNRVNITTN